jgi:hypothetical protein
VNVRGTMWWESGKGDFRPVDGSPATTLRPFHLSGNLAGERTPSARPAFLVSKCSLVVKLKAIVNYTTLPANFYLYSELEHVLYGVVR